MFQTHSTLINLDTKCLFCGVVFFPLFLFFFFSGGGGGPGGQKIKVQLSGWWRNANGLRGTGHLFNYAMGLGGEAYEQLQVQYCLRPPPPPPPLPHFSEFQHGSKLNFKLPSYH